MTIEDYVAAHRRWLETGETLRDQGFDLEHYGDVTQGFVFQLVLIDVMTKLIAALDRAEKGSFTIDPPFHTCSSCRYSTGIKQSFSERGQTIDMSTWKCGHIRGVNPVTGLVGLCVDKNADGHCPDWYEQRQRPD